ncbi:MAG: TlpA disulfide reductase family protein [Gemmataceae bacterium]
MVAVEGERASGKELTLPNVVVTIAAGPKVGQPLPAIDLKDVAGKPIDLASLKGRYVLLHGWAGWCVACRKDYAALRKARADFPAAKLAMVGLNLDADAEVAGRLAAMYEFAWPHAALGGPGAKAGDGLRIGAIPLYMVLTPDGTLAYRGFLWSEAEEFLRGRISQ